jgi:predicted dehydrogenase
MEKYAINQDQKQNDHKVPIRPNSPQIAVVGCGAITELFYLPALMKHRNAVKNLILIENDKARAKSITNKFKINNYSTDYQESLGKCVSLSIKPKRRKANVR